MARYAFDDPDLGIEWGLPAANAILSGKDADAPFWREFASPFVWPGE